MIKIAIDAMGGDFGAEPIIAGVIEALKQREFQAYLVGDESKLKSLIPHKYSRFITFVQSSEVFAMDESATDALKRKESTIFKAVELVRSGDCKAVVSAGHSGASMSLATLRLGRVKGISRPAIATLMPTTQANQKTLVLDVGANVDCKAENLFEFAIMGYAYAKGLIILELVYLATVKRIAKVMKLQKMHLKCLKNSIVSSEM